jgi:hypothetical protein
MSHSQALEEQLRIGRAYAAGEAEKGMLTHLVRSYGNDQTASPSAEAAMVEVILSPLLTGETFYWSPEMCRLLEHSAHQLREWVCDATIPIVPCGFCWLSRPFRCGKRYLWAFGWRVLEGGAGLSVVCYTIEGANTAPLPGAFFIIPDREVMHAHEPSFEKLSVIGAALLLLNQRILSAEQRHVERHTRKRLERDGVTREPLVRVVELRRTQSRSEHHGAAEPVDWSHQWIVSGHWRQQWHPSLDTHQARWIMPHVKGPEDKPLKPPRAKVFAVVR